MAPRQRYASGPPSKSDPTPGHASAPTAATGWPATCCPAISDLDADARPGRLFQLIGTCRPTWRQDQRPGRTEHPSPRRRSQRRQSPLRLASSEAPRAAASPLERASPSLAPQFASAHHPHWLAMGLAGNRRGRTTPSIDWDGPPRDGAGSPRRCCWLAGCMPPSCEPASAGPWLAAGGASPALVIALGGCAAPAALRGPAGRRHRPSAAPRSPAEQPTAGRAGASS